MNPTQRDLHTMLKAMAPDQSAAGMAKLASKLPFLKKAPRAYKPKQKNKRPEDDLQRVCVQYLNMHPRILYWATPANTWVGKMTGAKLGYLAKQKQLGVKKGVPDICLFFKNKHEEPTFCFLELKSEKGVVSEEQTMMMRKCEERGGFSAVIRSLDDIKSLLELVGY